MARHAAARPRWIRRTAVTAGVSTIALVGGTSVWFADAATSAGRTVHACYATHGGALRVLGHTPCTSTEKAISWSAAGPAGPPGVAAAYVGQTHFERANALPVRTPALEAETPALPAGDYVVDAMATVSWHGKGNPFCFDSVVSSHPSGGYESSQTYNSDSPDTALGAIAVDRAFRAVPAGDRIGIYCEDLTSDDAHNTLINSADLNAMLVNHLAVTTITRK